MIARSRTTLLKISIAVAAAATLIALGTDKAPAGEPSVRLLQAIDATVGSERVVAVYEKEEGACHVQILIEEALGEQIPDEGLSAPRARFDLLLFEAAVLDGAADRATGIACGKDAESLTMRQSGTMLAAIGE